jgi:peptidoglycan/LPS O-acetylase OafA/YrhL
MGSDQPSEQIASSTRYQMLDVWRGVVCLLVVLEHAGVSLWQLDYHGSSAWEGWLRYGVARSLQFDLGSPLFFVMSGYCIAACLAGARRRGTAPGAFFLRRIWRIFPTYWVALLGFVTVVLGLDAAGLTRLHYNDFSQAISSPRDLTRWQWFGNLTLIETWRPLVNGGEESVFTRVAWSLCHQEQFYFICVLALWLAPRRLEWALGLTTAAIVAYRVFAFDSGSTTRIEGTFLMYWHLFAIGLAVYWRLNRAESHASAPWLSRHAVELALLGFMWAGFGSGSTHTLAAAAFGLILIVLHRWDHLTGDLAWLAPVRACGRRSYSIYLTHLPVTTVGNMLLIELGLTSFWGRALVILPVVTAVAVAVGWAFHRMVESRFLGLPPLPKWPARVKNPPFGAVPACVGMALYGAAAAAIARARSRS